MWTTDRCDVCGGVATLGSLLDGSPECAKCSGGGEARKEIIGQFRRLCLTGEPMDAEVRARLLAALEDSDE